MRGTGDEGAFFSRRSQARSKSAVREDGGVDSEGKIQLVCGASGRLHLRDQRYGWHLLPKPILAIRLRAGDNGESAVDKSSQCPAIIPHTVPALPSAVNQLEAIGHILAIGAGRICRRHQGSPQAAIS